MKIKRFLLSYFLFIVSFNVLSQQRDTSIEDRLSIICKSWGLVKYYHPNVQKGEFDLDEGLLKMINKIETDTNTNVNDLIHEWILSLGSIEDYQSTKNTSNIHFEKNHNILWLKNTDLLKGGLTDLLYNLLLLSTNEKKYYVGKNRRIGNVEILNERKYNIKDINSKNIRLLILFRYWNIIEYFYPYKYMMDKNWDDVLEEYIPIFINANTQLDFQLAFLSLVVKLNDSHANFFTKDILQFFGTKYLPISFKMVQDQAIVSAYYHEEYARKNNLLIGDAIIMSDSVSVKNKIGQLDRYIHGSNAARKEYNYRYSLFNGSKDSTNVVIVRGNDTISQKVKRYPFKEFNYKPDEVPKWEILDNSILFIRLWMVGGKDIKEIKTLLRKSTGLILDLRVYPKSYIHYKLVKIIKKKESRYYKKIAPDLIHPGKYLNKESDPSGSKGSYQFDGNVLVLVNNRTISNGEFIVMDLQSCENVTVIGSQTAGAIGYNSTLEVLEGMFTSFTGTGIYYPDNSKVQRSGIRIDQIVEPSLEGIKNGEDEILTAALKYLSSNKKIK